VAKREPRRHHGQLSASIAHDVQNSRPSGSHVRVAAGSWLSGGGGGGRGGGGGGGGAEPPNLREVERASSYCQGGDLRRTRVVRANPALIRHAPNERRRSDPQPNDILEVIALTRTEAANIASRATQIAEGVPRVSRGARSGPGLHDGDLSITFRRLARRKPGGLGLAVDLAVRSSKRTAADVGA